MHDPPSAPFYSFRQCMMERYGAPLHRVPLDFGLGCPHRRPDGSGGCTFCPPDGSRAAHTAGVASLEDQVRVGVAFARRRYGARRFIAYVQAFTGTFAPPAQQHELYERVLAAQSFDAISIGTRPDCLPEATLELLRELQERLDVWIELGIQSTHDATLRRIRRGHTWAVGEESIRRVAGAGLKAAAHVILGLPGETEAHFQQTAERLARLPIAAVKIHNLHVVRGTELAEEFARQPFEVFDEPRYAAVLIDFLRRLPPRAAILRLNTDTPEAALIAPRWQMKKGQFLAWVLQEMNRRGVRQGDLWSAAGESVAMPGRLG